MEFERVGVAGLGLIGASVAEGLASGFARCVAGFDIDPTALGACAEIVEGVEDFDAMEGVDLLVLATPPGSIPDLLAAVAEWRHTPTVTDVASVKSYVARAVPASLRPSTLPGHPMAGHESSGSRFARPDLFHGATWVLCPFSETDRETTGKVLAMVRHLRALPLYMEADRHDDCVARTSHLPHLFASMLLCGAKHTDQRISGQSWKDLTRVGGANPELWADILLSNKSSVQSALAESRLQFDSVASAIEREDRDSLVAFFRAAKAVKEA